MACYTLLLVLVLPIMSNGVKINMQGALTVGKDVVDTLAQYLADSYKIDGRRALKLDDMTTDTIKLIINSAFLCRDLDVCQGSFTKFINDYITTLAKAIENIYEGLLHTDTRKKLVNEIPKDVIFEEELKLILKDVKKLLRYADKKLRDESDTFVWTDMMKKINAKFQDRSISFASDRLEGNVKEILEVKKKLTQKLVVDTTSVELDYIHTLCTKHSVCTKSYEVTKALKLLLDELQTLPDDKTKAFIRAFHETLPDTTFYSRISDVTANEFQAILNDMAYAENIHTKNVLGAVQKTVDERLESIEHKADNITGRDIKLAHIILSDMDHVYSKYGLDPFHKFMDKFYESKNEGRFSGPIRQAMKDMASRLSIETDEFLTKLVNEVRVFLEFTVDPEK